MNNLWLIILSILLITIIVILITRKVFETKYSLLPKCKPVDCNPVDCNPVKCDPVDCKQVESKAVDCKPVDCKPVDCKPVKCEPVDCRPVDCKLPQSRLEQFLNTYYTNSLNLMANDNLNKEFEKNIGISLNNATESSLREKLTPVVCNYIKSGDKNNGDTLIIFLLLRNAFQLSMDKLNYKNYVSYDGNNIIFTVEYNESSRRYIGSVIREADLQKIYRFGYKDSSTKMTYTIPIIIFYSLAVEEFSSLVNCS